MFAFQGVMVTMRGLMAGALLAGVFGFPAVAATHEVVQCRSHDFGYTECPAQSLQQPQLVYQISSSACIVNRTWGFDRGRGVLWMDDGCAGRFADVGGYHHGRTGQFDPGARRYTAHGEDAGPFVGGQALGALFEGAGSAAAGDAGNGKPAEAKPAQEKAGASAPVPGPATAAPADAGAAPETVAPAQPPSAAGNTDTDQGAHQ